MAALAALDTTTMVKAIKASGVKFVVALPDITTHRLLAAIAADPDLQLVNVCKEDEGISICAALSCCDKRALLLIQHTGLLDSLNSLRGVAVENDLPVCMMVGLLAKEPGVRPQDSARYGVRITIPVLEAMGVAHHVLEEPADLAAITPAIAAAYEQSRPVALLVGRRPE